MICHEGPLHQPPRWQCTANLVGLEIPPHSQTEDHREPVQLRTAVPNPCYRRSDVGEPPSEVRIVPIMTLLQESSHYRHRSDDEDGFFEIVPE